MTAQEVDLNGYSRDCSSGRPQRRPARPHHRIARAQKAESRATPDPRARPAAGATGTAGDGRWIRRSSRVEHGHPGCHDTSDGIDRWSSPGWRSSPLTQRVGGDHVHLREHLDGWSDGGLTGLQGACHGTNSAIRSELRAGPRCKTTRNTSSGQDGYVRSNGPNRNECRLAEFAYFYNLTWASVRLEGNVTGQINNGLTDAGRSQTPKTAPR